MPLPIEFQRNPIVTLTRGLPARRDQVLDIIEPAVPKHLRRLMLRLCILHDLAKVCSNHGFGAATVDVCDSLSKIRPRESASPRIQLGVYLPDRRGATTDDQHIAPDKHDQAHSNLTEQ